MYIYNIPNSLPEKIWKQMKMHAHSKTSLPRWYYEKMNSYVNGGVFASRTLSCNSAPCSAPGSPKSRVKFLCSHGGKIFPRPSDGQLKYVGGETRVISVPMDISFQGMFWFSIVFNLQIIQYVFFLSLLLLFYIFCLRTSSCMSSLSTTCALNYCFVCWCGL